MGKAKEPVLCVFVYCLIYPSRLRRSQKYFYFYVFCHVSQGGLEFLYYIRIYIYIYTHTAESPGTFCCVFSRQNEKAPDSVTHH